MSFTWTAELTPGADVAPDELEGAGIGRPFEEQAEAEAWLTQGYEDLADLGVAAVSLFDDGQLVYGPMPLDEQ
ncbi:hypothetical protein GCM10027030_15180 [Luteococcus sediminum]|uniref:hypothetical protein n=1 Tax=Luteococcus sp. TaxID=1969402 RepID=UPI003736D996